MIDFLWRWLGMLIVLGGLFGGAFLCTWLGMVIGAHFGPIGVIIFVVVCACGLIAAMLTAEEAAWG